MVTETQIAGRQEKVVALSGARLRFISTIPLYVFLIIWALMVIFPLAWMLYTSFKTNQELYASVWALPRVLQWDNYLRAWQQGKIYYAVPNSLFYSLASVGISDLFAAMAAYVLSRFKFKGDRTMFYYFMAGVFIPTSLTIIPTFLLLRSLALIDTHVGLMLVYTAWNIPFAVFVLYGYFRTIPGELMDAAAIDGCSELGVFWRIVVPLGKSGIIAVSILNFLWVWNELLYALVIARKDILKPLPLAVATVKTATYLSGDWVQVFAAASVMALPLLIGYIFIQKEIIEGATLGALKG
jgi:N-acetylglucosamine transport system permease protein